MNHAALTLFSCLVLAVGTASAQGPAGRQLAQGTRIRLEASGQWLTGAVHSLTSDTLALQLVRQEIVRLPLAGLKLEQSNGRESRWASAGRWAFRAGATLAVLGLLLPPTEADQTDPYRCISEACSSREQAAFGAGITGVLVGGAVGAFIPRERWITVSIPVRQR